MRRRIWSILLPLAALGLAVAAFVGLMVTSEPPSKGGGDEVPARLVRTETVTRKPQRIDVRATGTVMPAESVQLQPQVSGRVVAVADDLQPGSVVAKGSRLVQIERTDYASAVQEAEAQLAQARADLALEQGRSEVAATEYDAYAGDLDVPVDESLALRKPQRESAEAAVGRAEAQLTQARANLARTGLEAPFDAVVVSKSVDVGAQVGAQTQLAELVAVDRYWIRATLPIGHLGFVAVPGFNAETGATAVISQDVGGRRVEREGEVLRLYGGVTPEGRLAQLLIRVPDPRARGDEADGLPLLLDAFVDVTLRGRQERDLIRLDRAHLHERDRVWVFADGELDIREVEVIWRGPDSVLIDEGLADGDRIVVSPLTHPVAGLRLKRADEDDGG